MLHEPAAKHDKDYAVAYKQRLGVWMFLVYAIVYAGFVAINLIDPALMETNVIMGLNLAVTYGIALMRIGTFIHKTPPWDEYGRGSSGCQSVKVGNRNERV